MPGLKIAAQTKALPGPLKKALHTLGGLGCDGVQLDARIELRPADLSQTGLRQLRKMLDDLNLRVGSVAFPTRRGLGSADDFERRLEAAREAMTLASRLKSSIFVGQLGHLTAEDEGHHTAALVEALAHLAAHGDRLGVRLALQATFADLPAAVGFAKESADPRIGFDLHPARLIADSISPSQFVAALGHRVTHVHAVDGVHDLSAKRGVEVDLGRGTADFPELLGLLEQHAYQGWLTIERSHLENASGAIANAVQFLRSIQ